MTKINYPASSPYGLTPQTSWYIGNYVNRDIPAASDDSPLTLTKNYENRPDKLSYDLYGTPAYWWIFCVRNPFLRPDPIWSFTTGISIYVPSLAYLNKVLGT